MVLARASEIGDAPRRQHSRKSDETYGRIERLLPSPGSQRRPPEVAAERGAYLELFARQSRPGWDGCGDEPRLFDRGAVLTRRRPSRER
jgi:N6-adenosine-specific RNA methylase IME4